MEKKNRSHSEFEEVSHGISIVIYSVPIKLPFRGYLEQANAGAQFKGEFECDVNICEVA